MSLFSCKWTQPKGHVIQYFRIPFVRVHAYQHIYMCYKCGELGALWVPDRSFIHAYELVRISEIWKLTLVPGWKAEIQGWQATGSFGTHRVQAPLSSREAQALWEVHSHGAPAQAPPPGWGSARWGVCSSTIWDPFWGDVIFFSFYSVILEN